MNTKYQIIILAGGKSSRFYPFNTIHKSFFTIAGKTIIERTIDNILKKLDAEVLLVLNKKDYEIEKTIVESFNFGKKINCVVQEKPLGQADSILSAKKYIKSNFFVINSQQIDFPEFAESFTSKLNEKRSLAVIGSQETNDPWKYGILKINDKVVTGIVEKPKKGEEPSNKRVVGIYYFDKNFIYELEKTPISEYSLEETLNKIAQEGNLSTVEIRKDLVSLKYPWDLFSFKDKLLEDLKGNIDESAEIAKTAIIKGNVFIDKRVKVCDFSIIEGPCYIGEGSVVGSYSQVRGGTILEKNVKIQRYVDCKNSILDEGSSIHSGFIGDSIIGKNVKIGAGFVTANKRLDRASIKVLVKDTKIDTGINNFGIVIGDNSTLGINVSSMPGSIVGSNSLIYPNQVIKGTLINSK